MDVGLRSDMRTLFALLVLSALFIFGCAPGTPKWRAFQGTQTFVNQSDIKQAVELHPPVLVRLESWLGAGTFASKPAGAYMLSTAQGISRGNYVLDKSAGLITFTPEQSGVRDWSYSVQSDGSLRDAGGAIWTARP